MKKILTTLIFLSIISCKIGETETEKNAVQKVLDFYGGLCLKSKGFETKNGVQKNYYELVMSKSTLLNQDSNHLKSHSANIAYLFYSNLKDEKGNYNEVRVKINLENNDSETFQYADKDLIEIENLLPKVAKITKNILQNDYQTLASQFDKSFGIKKENIEELFTSIESVNGKIKNSQFQGFVFAKTDNYGDVILIRQILVLEKVNANMLFIFNRKNKSLIRIEFP